MKSNHQKIILLLNQGKKIKKTFTKSRYAITLGEEFLKDSAWRWAAIHCFSSPEPKLKIVTKDEDNN